MIDSPGTYSFGSFQPGGEPDDDVVVELYRSTDISARTIRRGGRDDGVDRGGLQAARGEDIPTRPRPLLPQGHPRQQASGRIVRRRCLQARLRNAGNRRVDHRRDTSGQDDSRRSAGNSRGNDTMLFKLTTVGPLDPSLSQRLSMVWSADTEIDGSLLDELLNPVTPDEAMTPAEIAALVTIPPEHEQVAGGTFDGSDNNWRTFYLALDTQPWANVKAAWFTPLTILGPGSAATMVELHVIEQTDLPDWVGQDDDDVRPQFTADGEDDTTASGTNLWAAASRPRKHEFSTGKRWPLTLPCPPAFISHIRAFATEVDTGGTDTLVSPEIRLAENVDGIRRM